MADEKVTLSRRRLLFGGLGRIRDKVAPNITLGAAQNMTPDKAEGDQALAKRDYEAASTCYQRCLAASPGHAEARGRLGYCLMRTDKLEQAAAEFLKALESEPKQHFARLYLGLTYAKLGDLQKAASTWREYFNPGQLTLQREINIQTALIQTSDPPSPEDVVTAVEEAIEEQKRVYAS